MVFGNVPWVAGLFYGIKPAVAAIVLQAVHRMGSKILKKPTQAPVLWAIAAASFIAVYGFKLPFPLIILLAALTGWLGAQLAPAQFSGAPGHAAAKASAPETPKHRWVIDDHTPTPGHARFSKAGLMKVLVVGGLLWLVPMALLVAWQGWSGTLAQMGWFFTKAALLTFGGAYAVLPYVYQGAVEHYGWLTAAQMMDGLALGETTPGPLIMVVAFVGFLGGWGQQVLGPNALFASAALAAMVVTWFTFLPSFVFILAGGPVVESTHGKLQFTAPLTAISAAVVGVMLNLALFFIANIAYKTGATGIFLSEFDWVALFLALATAIALIRYKQGVMTVIAACALLGLGAKMLGWA